VAVGPGECAKHPKRGKVRVVMRIGVTTCENDAAKDRPQERSCPESGRKSQGFDFSRGGREDEPYARLDVFGLCLPN